MSNNRNNNRRRGRGNNRPQGGNQLNRIDSRARGNAPQLLEKYRKLAHDSAMNGDRVQAEYYLQFADHYFRVIADTRSQKDEQRPRHGGDRDPRDDYGDEDSEGDYGQDRDERREPPTVRDEDEGERGDNRRGREPRESEDEYEPAENPFTRDSREVREVRDNRAGRDGREGRTDQQRGRHRRDRGDRPNREQEGESTGGFDASVLPPAIGRDEEAAEDKPRRARKLRAKPSDDQALETVD